MEKIWKRVTVSPDSYFFRIFQQAIKQSDGKTSMEINVINREKSEKLKMEVKDRFLFNFDYDEEDPSVSGIEVYKLIGEKEDAKPA